MPNPMINKTEKNIARYETIKDIRHLYKSKQYYYNDDDIAYKGLRDIRALSELEEDYYKPVKLSHIY